jgi:hypothetical protein
LLAVQHQLAFARPLAFRRRSVRRPFRPAQHPVSVYRLPHDIADRLASALAPFKNRESAFALAVFLGRYHSVPSRVLSAFVIDRRSLSGHDGLDLTEARVRGAIKALEAVGFLERAIPRPGSRYKATEEGLHRKPVAFVFGPEYAPAFIAASKRTRKAQDGDPAARRQLLAPAARRASTGNLEPFLIGSKSPKWNREAEPLVHLGEVRKECGWRQPPFAPDPRLEGALARLEKAFRESRGGESDR